MLNKSSTLTSSISDTFADIKLMKFLPRITPLIANQATVSNRVRFAIMYTTTAVKKERDKNILYVSLVSADFMRSNLYFVVCRVLFRPYLWSCNVSSKIAPSCSNTETASSAFVTVELIVL